MWWRLRSQVVQARRIYEVYRGTAVAYIVGSLQYHMTAVSSPLSGCTTRLVMCTLQSKTAGHLSRPHKDGVTRPSSSPGRTHRSQGVAEKAGAPGYELCWRTSVERRAAVTTRLPLAVPSLSFSSSRLSCTSLNLFLCSFSTRPASFV